VTRRYELSIRIDDEPDLGPFPPAPPLKARRLVDRQTAIAAYLASPEAEAALANALDAAPWAYQPSEPTDFAQHILAAMREARALADDDAAPIGDMPDGITLNGHLFVHVAACPCPRIVAEVERLAAQRDAQPEDE
jgi:hypothetical protein